MRHRKSFNHLGRKSAHRKAMLSNMATSLIMHKRITTTVAKAKALRSYVEPLITKSKTDSTHSRRSVFSYLQDKDAVNELFREVSTKVIDRPGGYTRILKTGNRLGDNAEMCFIELVDYNENMLTDTTKTKSRTRRRRGSKKQATESTSEATAGSQEQTPARDEADSGSTASEGKTNDDAKIAEATKEAEVLEEGTSSPEDKKPEEEKVDEKDVETAEKKDEQPKEKGNEDQEKKE